MKTLFFTGIIIGTPKIRLACKLLVIFIKSDCIKKGR